MTIEEIILKHTKNTNSFIDEEGHNHFRECVEELKELFDEALTKEAGFGERLRKARVLAGMTMDELARTVGRSKSWISLLESGSRNASAQEQRVLLTAVKVFEST